jgi:HSP20 family protein
MLTTWDAVATLDHMFDDVMGSAIGTATNPRTFDPSVDIRITDEEVLLHCDVPGVRLDDLEITLENHVLTMKGARKFEGRENEQIMLGRAYGAFRKSFTLPDFVDEEKLTATVTDGVLAIRIPKHPKAQPKKIQVVSGDTKQLNR